MKKLVILALTIVSVASAAFAAPEYKKNESALQMLRENPNRAGVYSSCYEFSDVKLSPAPKGYSLIYLSHYGRHGSRSSWGSDAYYNVINVLSAAKEQGVLSAQGDSLLAETRALLKAYNGMDGRLTRKGEEEERKLGALIYSQYQALFKQKKTVRVMTSFVPRAIVSMTSFTNELSRCNKNIQFDIDCGEAYMPAVATHYRNAHKTASDNMLNKYFNEIHCNVESFYKIIFTDSQKGIELAGDAENFVNDAYQAAQTAQALGVDANPLRYIPEDILYKNWDFNLRKTYLENCNSKEFGAGRLFQADGIVNDLVCKADDALENGTAAVDLKFGHERPLLALVSYIGIDGVGESYSFDQIPFKLADPYFTPLASNFQLAFYRNNAGNVLVKAVYNGREHKIVGIDPVCGVYYSWDDLKNKIFTRAELRTEIVPAPSSMKYVGPMHSCKGESVSIDPALGAEQYTIDTKGTVAKIKAGSEAGVFYAMQTLKQIRVQHPGDRLPGLLINDKPAFAYRGAMLDCCRYFFSVDEVKKFIDIIAAHKINVFHWHLTEDQGWRVEIKKYPKLTEVSAYRNETLVGHKRTKPEIYDGKRYGGYYTQDQMREIVKYAKDRFITVIPEIEMPGHSLAVLAAYPELGCTGGPYEVATSWGVFKDILCAGKPETIQFLHDVLDEVCEIFPSEYIHIGGDEAPRDRWRECPHCQAMMKKMGYTREAQLQSMITADVEKYLAAKGRKIIGWDEILDGGVEKSATVMSWRGADGGKKGAALGNDVVMVPNGYFYFDYYQTANPRANAEPLAIGGYVSLEKVYKYNPYDGINYKNRKYIKGIQCNVWTEYIPSFEQVQKMLLPRLAASSEIAWSIAPRDEYYDFVDRCKHAILPLYTQEGFLYSPYAFLDVPAL